MCGTHYSQRSGSLTCHGCQKPLVDTFVDAMDKRWHPTCLVCTVSPFRCVWVFVSRANLCRGLTLLSSIRSSGCVARQTCRIPFESGYYPHDGMPFCKKDFFRIKNLLCMHCDQPITDVYEDVGSKRYHLHCRSAASASPSK